ncbi:MAG: membrane protein insertion efficiency factor YidD [Alphaproteobacteria bacterium]|nr:membrane protein insertion efficiency factor YidD [Alphaproteobacteria bacterium]
MKQILLFLIKLYQYGISPMMGSRCRFFPSCSVYAKQAIEKYGAWRGAWMAIKRISRCRPGAGFGYDPVPASPAE